jgi:hypothetical protein
MRHRLPVEKDKLIIKERPPFPKSPISKLHPLNSNISVNLKTECLNVFDDEDINFVR